VWKDNQTLFKRGKSVAIELKLPRSEYPVKTVWAWMKFKLRETSCTNTEEWKGKIVKLWVTRMIGSDNPLKKLVKSMPKRLAESSRKRRAMVHM
jgi:hypothetical protein